MPMRCEGWPVVLVLHAAAMTRRPAEAAAQHPRRAHVPFLLPVWPYWPAREFLLRAFVQ